MWYSHLSHLAPQNSQYISEECENLEIKGRVRAVTSQKFLFTAYESKLELGRPSVRFRRCVSSYVERKMTPIG